MTIPLLNNCMQVEIFYETEDRQFSDNICIRIRETCPNEERLMLAEESNIFITPRRSHNPCQCLVESRQNEFGCMSILRKYEGFQNKIIIVEVY